MVNPDTAHHQDQYPTANAQTEITVTRKDLPLHCPTPTMALWSSHPRVFLPIDETPDGRYLCPYCGTQFTLKDDD
ncbi:zinc-finger domain-containing protein [Thioalkalivibrio sp. ALMg9]|uniref:zinc-finger domain-containing protein n=1 Tax=Thioalkalivibrio sp. ALMg9 TaxID=1266912 RepID=UPI0003655B95|nr:zinc-finger domain-containing protein [Thioalkalivibrio sp. ALMg9]